MCPQGPSSQVFTREIQRPVSSLLRHALGVRREWGDDIDCLGDVGHAHPFGLSDKHVEPGGNGEGVGEGVEFLSAELTRSPDGIPYVPFVKADCGARDYAFGDAGEVNGGGGHLDGSFGGKRCGDVGVVATQEQDVG